MLIVHPALSDCCSRAEHLGGDNTNVLWIVFSSGADKYFLASVYLPDNRLLREADEVARQLLRDIDQIPESAFIVLLVDFNFDPFTSKGANKAAAKLLTSHRRLALIPRPHAECFTRPVKRSHIDT